MAGYKPMPSPGDLTSPRKRALEIGTELSGFQDHMEYVPHAGVPAAAGMPVGTYTEQGPFVSSAGAPIDTPVPFIVKK